MALGFRYHLAGELEGAPRTTGARRTGPSVVRHPGAPQRPTRYTERRPRQRRRGGVPATGSSSGCLRAGGSSRAGNGPGPDPPPWVAAGSTGSRRRPQRRIGRTGPVARGAVTRGGAHLRLVGGGDGGGHRRRLRRAHPAARAPGPGAGPGSSSWSGRTSRPSPGPRPVVRVAGRGADDPAAVGADGTLADSTGVGPLAVPAAAVAAGSVLLGCAEAGVERSVLT